MSLPPLIRGFPQPSTLPPEWSPPGSCLRLQIFKCGQNTFFVVSNFERFVPRFEKVTSPKFPNSLERGPGNGPGSSKSVREKEME
jgi:hypothetical protein